MVASGIPPLAAMLMSLLVFAGASMVASAQLLSSGTPVLLVILTTLFINLRFMMYSASLRLHFQREPLRWRLLFAYLIADNAYALTLGRFSDRVDAPGRREFFLGAGLTIWAAWQISVGAGVPASWRLEFAAPLAFIAMTIPHLRDRAMIAAALAAGAAVIAAHELPLRLNIVAAAAVGITVGLFFEKKTR